MTSINKYVQYLKEYDGQEITLMEVCGSHTAAIAKSGIKSIISSKIHLVSGPGCPVCVTPSAYIDRLIELAKEPATYVVTFGDMLRVPGSHESLSMAKSEGAKVVMVYSPVDIIQLAENNPDKKYVFAAVGFETTTPVYTLLLDQVISRKLTNVRILTALKRMPEAVDWICRNTDSINGFIAPGHVCAVTGSDIFKAAAEKYHIPFGVAGFGAQELIIAIYGLVHSVINKENTVTNYYPSVVTSEGNKIAINKVQSYFEPCDAVWRGMGVIKNSGMILKEEYRSFDAGSINLTEDNKINAGCSCDKVLMGKIEPKQCPLFNRVCRPDNPQGACMVSSEGACYQFYLNGGTI